MCTKYVSQLSDDFSTAGELQHAMLAVVHWRRSNELYDAATGTVLENYRINSSSVEKVLKLGKIKQC